MSSPQAAGTQVRFDREKYFPSSWNTGTEQFCALFQNRYGYIYKPLTGGTWLSADEKWQLTDSLILKSIACAHQKYFIGTRAGRASKFAVLDIDAGSKYHSLKEFNRIKSVLAQAGIHSIVPYRSSVSGGWHLYIFFDRPISSRDLNKQLTLLLQLNEFAVQRGQLEVFPNPGQASSLGFGLRLPMQPGWAWLDSKTMEIETDREEITAFEALEFFLLDLANNCNSEHDFHRLKRYVDDALSRNANTTFRQDKIRRRQQQDNVIPLRKITAPADSEYTSKVNQIFGALPPGILVDTWLKGRHYFEDGLSDSGQRSEAICSISHYLFYGDPENEIQPLGYGHEQSRQRLIENVLEAKHNYKSKDINEQRADALAQIRRAANWRPEQKQHRKNDRAYTKDVPASWPLENERRRIDARRRIEQSVQQLKDEGIQPTASAIQRKAKCSWKTLYKHSDLWTQPIPSDPLEPAAYEQLAAELFDGSTHEYNDLQLPTSPVSGPVTEALNPFASSSLISCGTESSSRFNSGGELLAVLLFRQQLDLVIHQRLVGLRKSRELRRASGLVWNVVQVVNCIWLFPLFCFCFLYDPVLRPWSSSYLIRRRRWRLLHNFGQPP